MLHRYCLQWHRIVQGRVNQEWWEKVLAPLEQLELAATNDSEDMELQTRALTEPLPTNQQVQPIQDLREINMTYFTPFCFFKNNCYLNLIIIYGTI